MVCVWALCFVRPQSDSKSNETQQEEEQNPLNTNNAQNKSKRLCVTNKTIVELMNVFLLGIFLILFVKAVHSFYVCVLCTFLFQ